MKRNNIHHFEAVQTKAGMVVPSSIPFHTKQVSLILDPPRTGISKKVIQNILHFMPGQIVYVSCNPSTQARDVSRILQEGGYTLTHIAFFDLYPNTHHIESTVILERL